MKRVSGKAEVLWTVELPDKLAREGNLCDDPAIGAFIEFIPQMGKVWCWGEDCEPAMVFTETHEEDIEIEEDERDE